MESVQTSFLLLFRGSTVYDGYTYTISRKKNIVGLFGPLTECERVKLLGERGREGLEYDPGSETWVLFMTMFPSPVSHSAPPPCIL